MPMSTSEPRPRGRRPLEIDGSTYCVVCHEEGHLTPNDPDHPRSPYCAEHRRATRTANQAKWRDVAERNQRLVNEMRDKGIHVSPDGYVVLPGEVVQVILGDAVGLAQACADAERLTWRYAGGVVPREIKEALVALKAESERVAEVWTKSLTK